MDQSKPKRKWSRLIPCLVLALMLTLAHAAVTWSNSSRTKAAQKTETVQLSSNKKEAVTQPPSASEVTPPTPTPVTEPAPVVEPTPEPAAVVAPTPTTGTGDCSLVNNYDWPKDIAMRVCMQESGGNPNNQNWKDYHAFADCYGSFGLFQINCSHGQVYDGAENVAIAYDMWKAAGGTFAKFWPNTCKIVGC